MLKYLDMACWLPFVLLPWASQTVKAIHLSDYISFAYFTIGKYLYYVSVSIAELKITPNKCQLVQPLWKTV